MSACEAPGTRAVNNTLPADANCKTDKPAPPRISSGPPLGHPQHVQADRDHTRHRSPGARSHAPRVAQASAGDSSPKVDQAKTVYAKIDELKTKLGIDRELQGPKLEAGVDNRIGVLKGQLKVNFKSPWDQRSKNIEAHIAELESAPLSNALTIQDWKTLKQLVDLKCLISPGVEGNINQMKSKLGMGRLEGNVLKKAVDGEVKRLAARVNFPSGITWGELHDRIETKLPTVTDSHDRAWLSRLQLAVDLKLQLPIKTSLAGRIAEAEPQARTFLSTLVVSKAVPEALAGHAKVVVGDFRDYSAKMAKLHGGKSGDYELKVPLDVSEHTKLCGVLKGLADKGLITKEDVALITTMTSPAATNPAHVAITDAR